MHRREHANRSPDNRIHPTLTQGPPCARHCLGHWRKPKGASEPLYSCSQLSRGCEEGAHHLVADKGQEEEKEGRPA